MCSSDDNGPNIAFVKSWDMSPALAIPHLVAGDMLVCYNSENYRHRQKIKHSFELKLQKIRIDNKTFVQLQFRNIYVL